MTQEKMVELIELIRKNSLEDAMTELEDALSSEWWKGYDDRQMELDNGKE